MPYVLGIDMGGTSTTAAVARLSAAGWDAPELVGLGTRSHAIPSVLHLAADGVLTVGEPVQHDPTRVARGFVGRIGDDVPLIVAGEPFTPPALTAALAMYVVERVLTREGEPAEQVVISHPACWGPYRRGLLRQALSEFGLRRITLLPEPVVAAEGHAAAGWSGNGVAVYSLGGNDFEAALVRRDGGPGFRVLRRTELGYQFGGVDVDDALIGHVQTQLGEQFRQLRRSGAGQARLVLYGLRRECIRAKERLSTVTDTEVLVPLPQGQVAVPVSRAELAELVRPALEVTVDALARIVRAEGTPRDWLDGVLLVGGAVRMPLVAELVAAELPYPITVEPEARTLAATGAAVAAGKIATPPAERSPMWTDEPSSLETSGEQPLGGWGAREAGSGPPPRPPVRVAPLRLSGTRRRRFGLLAGRR